MKLLFCCLMSFAVLSAFSQADTLPARVYVLSSMPVMKDSSRLRVQIMDGRTTLLSNLEAHLTILQPGQAAHPPHTHSNTEELIIVKEGVLSVTINGKTKLLSQGGVSLALPGEEHGAVNAGTAKASYYVIKYTRPAVDAARGEKAGGSVLMKWSEPAVENTDRGQRRNFFVRPTSLFEKFDMHVTTLNKGFVSHAPHTHLQEEIIIVQSGQVEMQIGNSFFPATAGDIVFLSSGIPHALRNTGNGATTYYAFQWQ